jgi:hypothetical protein
VAISRVKMNTEDSNDRLSRNVGNKLPLLSCVISQKSEVLTYFAVEAWNDEYTISCTGEIFRSSDTNMNLKNVVKVLRAGTA